MFEKIYYIHNPLNGLNDWVTEREMHIGSQKLKNVFGVLYIDDVKIMLRYNLQFQEAVMKANKIIGEDNLSLKYVCRLITKEELNHLLEKQDNNNGESHPAWIQLKDGYFYWNKETGTLEEAMVSKNTQ
jgi:hypothetical protein